MRRHGQVVRHGSAKPLSPVRIRVAPPKNEAPQNGVLFRSLEVPLPFGSRFLAPRARKPVRLPRPKVGVLAHQAQGEGIFARRANGGWLSTNPIFSSLSDLVSAMLGHPFSRAVIGRVAEVCHHIGMKDKALVCARNSFLKEPPMDDFEEYARKIIDRAYFIILNKIDELDGTNERLLKHYRENIEKFTKV